jgi:hypothetical protein
MKETPEFGLGADSVAMRGIEQTFMVKVEDDTLRQSGTLKFGGANPENMKLEVEAITEIGMFSPTHSRGE